MPIQPKGKKLTLYTAIPQIHLVLILPFPIKQVFHPYLLFALLLRPSRYFYHGNLLGQSWPTVDSPCLQIRESARRQ